MDSCSAINYIIVVLVLIFIVTCWILKKGNRIVTVMDKDNIQELTKSKPNASRKNSGCNWENFKNLIGTTRDPSKLGKRKSSKNNKARKTLKMNINLINPPKDIENNDDKSLQNLTKHLAMDCEMVGIGDGTESMIARVSIVNEHDFCVYDKYVQPRERIVDYRTPVSGIRKEDLQKGEEFTIVQKEVAAILRGKTVIGHAIKHDFRALYLSHPKRMIRDTSKFKPFREAIKTKGTPGLKRLAELLLGKQIQNGEHDSVEDARTAMQLYMLYKNVWESQIYS